MTPKIAEVVNSAPEIYSRKQKSECDEKEDRKRDDREDVADECGSIDPLQAKCECEEERVKSTNKKVAENSDQKQL